MLKEITITTKKRKEIIDITSLIENDLNNQFLKDGLVYIATLHTTTGIMINENEELLKNDFLNFFESTTSSFNFKHDKVDNNAYAHIVSSIIGHGISVIIKEQKLLLGRWQRVLFVELDGPRERKVVIKNIYDK